MEEGNWIDMTGIPLIATEGVAAEGIVREVGAEGGGTEAGHGDEAEQGTEAKRNEGVDASPLQRKIGQVMRWLSMLYPRPTPPPVLMPRMLKVPLTCRSSKWRKLRAGPQGVMPMMRRTRLNLKQRSCRQLSESRS
jgi:hypothetical protein